MNHLLPSFSQTTSSNFEKCFWTKRYIHWFFAFDTRSGKHAKEAIGNAYLLYSNPFQCNVSDLVSQNNFSVNAGVTWMSAWLPAKMCSRDLQVTYLFWKIFSNLIVRAEPMKRVVPFGFLFKRSCNLYAFPTITLTSWAVNLLALLLAVKSRSMVLWLSTKFCCLLFAAPLVIPSWSKSSNWLKSFLFDCFFFRVETIFASTNELHLQQQQINRTTYLCWKRQIIKVTI